MADDTDLVWRITPHACRNCFGRVLARPDGEGERVYRCSNCGLERPGRKTDVICGCGISLKGGKNAGLRCIVQAKPTPECPAQVVVEEVSGGKL